MIKSKSKIVEIIAIGKRFALDKRDILFKCKKCNEIWEVMTNLKGRASRIPKSAWQCPNGCKDILKKE